MSLRAQSPVGSSQPDPPAAKKGGIRRRLSQFFSRSEISLPELQRKEGSRDCPSIPGTVAQQDGKGQGRRKEKRSKKQGSLERMAAEDETSAGKRWHAEPLPSSRPQKTSSKPHALSYSESDLWRNGLLRTFGSLPWRRRQSSHLELSGAGRTEPQGSSLGQSWPFGRLQRPAVGSDMDMGGWSDLCSSGNLAREQETPEPSAWPMDTGNLKPARSSQVEICTSIDSLLGKEDGSSWEESVSISSSSLYFPTSPETQAELAPSATQEEPSISPGSLEEWAESVLKELFGSGTLHPMAGGQPDLESHGHRESISKPEPCPFTSPVYNQISKMEEPAIASESPVLGQPLETFCGVEPTPVKRPAKIRYEVMITLSKEAEKGAKSKAVHGNGPESHRATLSAAEAGVSQQVAESQKMDEQSPGEPARPAPQLSTHEEFQNFTLQREGPAGVTGQVRPVTGYLATPLPGPEPSPRQRQDQQEQSLPHCRDVSAAHRRGESHQLSSSPIIFGPHRDFRGVEGETAQSERPIEVGAELDPSLCKMKKVSSGARSHPTKPEESAKRSWFSWKKASLDQPKEETKPSIPKVSLLSLSLDTTASPRARAKSPRARAKSPGRVSVLLEAWEKGTIGRESEDLPSATDSRCSRPPSRQKDTSAHSPVFSQIYSPVPKESRPTERGKETTGSATVTESQIDDCLHSADSLGPSAIGTTMPGGSPRESHLLSACGITSVTHPQRPQPIPKAGSTTIFRSEREPVVPQAGSAVVVRSGSKVIMPKAESTSVNESPQERHCPPKVVSSASIAGPRSESCWHRAGGNPTATGEAGGSPAAESQGESCMAQAGGANVSESQRSRGVPGASPFVVSSAEKDNSLADPGGTAAAVSEMESIMPGTDSAILTAPQRTKSPCNVGAMLGLSSQGESGNPEPLHGVQWLPVDQKTASHAVLRGEGDEPAQNAKGFAQEPDISSEDTEVSSEAVSQTQPTGSHQETEDEEPDLSVDMELLVDTLRNMDPTEIRKPPKVCRPLLSSSRGKYAILPPIDEHHIAPKSQVPLPESLSELFGLTEQKHWKEEGSVGENMDPSEEMEIENPYLSKDEKPEPKEEPRKVYPWENMSTKIEEKTLSLLGRLRQHPEEEKATGSASRVCLKQSVLFSGNILRGASLLTNFREQKAAPTEDKPYSRLDNSILYRRYVSSVLPPLKALEKEREGRSSPTPVDPALLNTGGRSWTPSNGPQLQSCEPLITDPSLRLISWDPWKAPGTDRSTDQIPPLFKEAEKRITPPQSQGPTAAEASDCTLPRQQEAKKPPTAKPNMRPGKIILFSESGFAGQKREIWSDVIDATSWELSQTVSIQVVRGGWVMYEKPRFHGRKCVLAEGDVEINNPWTAYQKEGEAPDNTPFRIGSFKRVVRDYQIPEICVFTEENGEGTKVRFIDSSEDTRIHSKPLKASSIIVHSGLWLIYSKPFFDDDPYVLEPGGYPSLKAWGAKDPSVCSMHPIKLGCPAVEKPGEPKAVIYEKAGFQGHSCEVNRDIYDLKKEENSQGPVMSTMGSLRILGGCWVGYEKEGFRGHQYLLEEGEYHDWTQWGGYNNKLVSLRLIRTDFSDPALVLFEAMDLQDGPSVELSEALPDVELAGYGTTTQSIHVLSGVWVAYENTNFSGEQYILEKGVYRSCEDWGASDCQIHSVQPVLQVGEHSLRFISRIQLFSDLNFLGDHVSFEYNQMSLLEAFTPQSCRIHGGSWILYDGQDCEGEQHVLSDGEYPTLTAMGCVTSTVIRSLKKVPVFFSEPSIFLHGLECFEGKEIELNSEVRSLQAEGFNNHVLSVRVKGGIWVLCEHSNFRGRQWLLECAEITNWLTYSGRQHIGSLYPIRQRRIYFRIKNVELQFFLSVPDDAEDMKAGRVVVSDLSDQSSSVWYYEEGLIKNQVAPTMSLQVIGPGGRGAKVVLWAESRVPRQTWSVDSFGRICSQMFEDMILDVKGGRSYDRDHAILWDMAEERATQIWDIQVL